MKKKSVFMGMIAISALVWMTGCAGRAVESSDIDRTGGERRKRGNRDGCNKHRWRQVKGHGELLSDV